MTRRSSSRERSVGQSLVEFAIFVPVLAAILLLAVDVGRVYLGWVTLTNVARIGANFAAQNPDAWSGSGDGTVQARYRSLMSKDATGIDCSLPATLPNPTFSDSDPYAVGSKVQVDLTCTFRLLTPFVSGVIGDGAGNIAVGTSSSFTIRSGSINGVVISGGASSASPTPSPSPSPTPSPTPTVTPTPTPLASGATPGPTGTPTPTQTPVVVAFYGIPTSPDSSGGGPPGSVDEDQILGVPNLSVTFYNTTTGVQGSCLWSFGDGSSSTSCTNSFVHTYTAFGTFDVTLTVNGQPLTRSSYVLTTCKVPAFAGVRVNSATSIWIAAGFTSSNLTKLDGNGNYKIGYQSLAGGIVSPPGGCSGATTLVGP